MADGTATASRNAPSMSSRRATAGARGPLGAASRMMLTVARTNELAA